MIDANRSLSSNLNFRAKHRLIKIIFTADGIFMIVRLLDPNKAQCQDKISFRMLKTCVGTALDDLQHLFVVIV